MTARRAPEDFLPLTRTTSFILLSLSEGPKHGYAISKHVEAISDGSFRIAIGNLYVSLRRLLDAGVIEAAGDVHDDIGERRKTYRLNAVGRKVLALERERVQQMNRILTQPARKSVGT